MTHSLKVKLILGLSLLIVPLTTLLLIHNAYSISVVRRQAVESNRNIVTFHMERIDRDLGDIAEYLKSMLISGEHLITMGTTGNESEFQLTKILLANRLNRDILLYRSIDTVFVYTSQRNDYLEATLSLQFPEERMAVKNMLTQELAARAATMDELASRWRIRVLDGKAYLIYALVSNGVWVGAWVNIDRLLEPLMSIDFGREGKVLFMDSDGKALGGAIADPNEKDYLTIRAPSRSASFSLVAKIAEAEILRNLPEFQLVIRLVTASAIAFFPLFLLVLHRTVLVPLKGLVIATHRIREGDMEHRVVSTRSSEEFEALVNSFNAMVERINQLKIDVYEEQIAKQKIEYARLQSQVKPHFFLNTLNVIYHLAELKRTKRIQELVSDMVSYFRFMLRDAADFVPLDEELSLVHAYLGIQDARSPGALKTEFAVEKEILSVPVPPLMIQTFVENAVKYAASMDESVTLRVTAAKTSSADGRGGIRITIEDNGPGFPEEFLRGFGSGAPLAATGGERVGIQNIRSRLDYLYGGGATLSCRNAAQGGAKVEILLP